MKRTLLALCLTLSIAPALAGTSDVERRLSGVQKQVTVLHAKVESLEHDRANLKKAAVLNGAARNALENRVTVLEKKVSALIRVIQLHQENGKNK